MRKLKVRKRLSHVSQQSMHLMFVLSFSLLLFSGVCSVLLNDVGIKIDSLTNSKNLGWISNSKPQLEVKSQLCLKINAVVCNNVARMRKTNNNEHHIIN